MSLPRGRRRHSPTHVLTFAATRVAAVVATLAIAASAAAVASDSPETPDSTHQPRTWWGVTEVTVPGAGAPASPEIDAKQTGHDAGPRQTATERHRAQAASRSAYRGMSGTAALRLAEGGPSSIGRPPFQAKRATADGFRVERIVSAHTAVVRDGRSGTRLLATTSAPLLAGDDATDLSLVRQGGEFVPAKSSATIAISADADAGAWFGEGGFRVRPLHADDSTALEGENGVFFADTHVDTDTIITPETFGASLDFQLRSPASPERIPLAVDLPQGAHLAHVAAHSADAAAPEPDTIVVRAADGSDLGYIYPTIAYDASGERVPSHVEISDAGIDVVTEHRDRAVEYPVTVDPSIVSSVSQWGGNWNGWQAASNMAAGTCGSGASLPRFVPQTLNNSDYAPGMYNGFWGTSSWSCYGAGSWAEFFWQAPANTYIYSVDYFNYSHSTNSAATMMFGGIESTATGWVSGVSYNNGAAGNYFSNTSTFAGAAGSTCCKSGVTSGYDRAVFGLYVLWQQMALPPSTHVHDAVQSITVNLKDSTNPTVAASPVAFSQWTNDATGGAPNAHYLPVTTTDVGLGVKTVTLTGAASGGGSIVNGCSGDPYRSPCPTSASTAFSYTLPEGVSNLQLQLWDIVDRPSNVIPWTNKIDNSGPALTLSGTLPGQNHIMLTGGGNFTLTAAATDGVQGGAAADLRSGVASIAITDNGIVQGSSPSQLDTSDSAPLTRTGYSFDASTADEGVHDIKVTATDRAGNTTTQTITVVVDRAPTWSKGYDDVDDSATTSWSTDNGSSLRYSGTDGSYVSNYCTFDPDVEDATACLQDDSMVSAVAAALAEPPVTDPSLSPAIIATNSAATTQESGQSFAAGTSGSSSGSRYAQPGVGYTPPPSYSNCQTPTARYGLSDLKAWVWYDPQLLKFGIHRARTVVGWDIVARATAQAPFVGTTAQQGDVDRLTALDNWMTNVLKKCDEPMISFELSHSPGHGPDLPTKTQYKQAITSFHDRYPFVSIYSSWNEPNRPGDTAHGLGQPTADQPATAGMYWSVMDAACRQWNCIALAGEFTDQGYSNSGGLKLSTYISRYRDAMSRPAQVWAIHPYYSGNHPNLTDAGWHSFLNATTCPTCTGNLKNPVVWITEVGGLMSLVQQKNQYVNGQQVMNPTPETHTEAEANQALVHLLSLATQPRVKRFYYYAWIGDLKFDSGLIDYKTFDVRPTLACTYYKAMRNTTVCPSFVR